MRVEMPDGKIARFEVPEPRIPADELLTTSDPTAQSVEAGIISAGRSFKRAGQGIQRFLGGVDERRDIQREVQADNQRFEPIANEFPIAAAVGAAAPTFAIPGGQGAKGAAAIGGITGLLQPEGNPMVNAALGMGVGASTKALGDISTGLAGGRLPASTSRTAQKQNAGKTLDKRADELGIKLTPAQARGGFGAKIAEDATRANAFTADIFQDMAENNLDAINKAALKRFGKQGTAITGKVLEDIRTEIGETFEIVASAVREFKPTVRTTDLLRQVDDVIVDARSPQTTALYNDVLEVMTRPESVSTKAIPNLINRINGVRGAANAAGETVDAEALDLMEESVLAGLEDSLNKTARRHLRQARRQWRDYKILSGNNVVVDGDIQLGALRNQLKGKFTGKAFQEGRETNNELFEIARLFEQLERSSSFVGRQGGSQTAGRQLLQSAASLPIAAPLAIGQNAPKAIQDITGQLGSRLGSAAARIAAIKSTERNKKP